MRHHGGSKPAHSKLELAEQALALHKTGKKYTEIGALMGFESSSPRMAAIKASSLVHRALRVEASREFYTELFKNGINDNTTLDDAIGAMNMSVRLANIFKNEDIKTVGDARQMTDAQLLRLPNFGNVTLAEWKEMLSKITPSASS